MPVSSRFLRKVPSINPTVGKILDAGKAHGLQLIKKVISEQERGQCR